MQKLHQVFIGCPFSRAIRKNYDALKKELEDETPLHLILADTVALTSTDYLLEHITTLIRESAACLFDASGGNPNVSLEVGIAHALPAEFLITLYTRKPRQQKIAEEALAKEGEVKPIISDLQGRNRVEYKTYSSLKDQIVKRYLNKLPYVKRWTDFKSRNSGPLAALCALASLPCSMAQASWPMTCSVSYPTRNSWWSSPEERVAYTIQSSNRDQQRAGNSGVGL